MSEVTNVSDLPVRTPRTCVRTAFRAFSVVAVLVAMASGVCAQVVIDRAASILIYPEIIASDTRDTTIQIVNTSNAVVHARCFYVNFAGTCVTSAAPCVTTNDCSDCVQSGAVTDFAVDLTLQQPAFWVASQGRASGPGALVPPVTIPFFGELVCVEVNADRAPISGDHLIGEATITDTSSGDVAKSHAAGIQGLAANNGDNVLCLGGGVTPECPTGAEYAACPQSWLLDFVPDGTQDGILGAGSAVHTNLAVVPCTLDLLNQNPGQTTVGFQVSNQFAQTFSSSRQSSALFDTPITSIDTTNPTQSIFARTTLGTDYARAVMASAQGNGFIATGQEFHTTGTSAPSEALSPYPQGAHAAGDRITLP